MKWKWCKRFLGQVGLHFVAVMGFMGLSIGMGVSGVELPAHVHQGLQLVGHFLESLST